MPCARPQDRDVLARQSMASHAKQLSCSGSPAHEWRSPDVLSVRNRLQVVGVAAPSVSAEVINLQPVRDLAPERHVRDPVSVSLGFVLAVCAGISKTCGRSDKPAPAVRNLWAVRQPEVARGVLYSIQKILKLKPSYLIFFLHLALTPIMEISSLLSADSFLARAFPPFDAPRIPRATAAGFFFFMARILFDFPAKVKENVGVLSRGSWGMIPASGPEKGTL